MQNASTVIRPRPSRFQSAASSPPDDARSWGTQTKPQVEIVKRAGHAMPVLLQDVGVDHGGGKIIQRQMLKWAAKGRRPELTGGGLIRSSGGWRAVKEAYRQGVRLASDERLLGSSQFVETTLKAAGEAYDRRMRRQSAGIDLSSMMGAVCRYVGVEEKELAGPSKQVKITRARALIGYMATQGLSISGSEAARRLNIDRSAVSRAVQRARHDAQLMADANSIWKLIKAPVSQQSNRMSSSYPRRLRSSF